MSVPQEEREALTWAWKFLCELLDKKKTPRVQDSVRVTASHILRHYPGPVAIDLFWRREEIQGHKRGEGGGKG